MRLGLCGLWWSVGLCGLCGLSVLLSRPSACPRGFLCVPYAVGGPPSSEPPYIEYSDVTATATVYRVSRRLKGVVTPFQSVGAFDSIFFGRVLTIDGALMITQRDEANYHEALVHTPLAYLPHARRVLVVGGGDGGTVTQLTKHPNLREIVWCEIDEVVIQTAKELFPKQSKWTHDPRRLCSRITPSPPYRLHPSSSAPLRCSSAYIPFPLLSSCRHFTSPRISSTPHVSSLFAHPSVPLPPLPPSSFPPRTQFLLNASFHS